VSGRLKDWESSRKSGAMSSGCPLNGSSVAGCLSGPSAMIRSDSRSVLTDRRPGRCRLPGLAVAVEATAGLLTTLGGCLLATFGRSSRQTACSNLDRGRSGQRSCRDRDRPVRLISVLSGEAVLASSEFR
jgi:hypothetical protein